MKLYQQLQSTYAGEIQQVKRLRRAADAAREAIGEIDADDYARYASAINRAAALDTAANDAMTHLMEQVEREYRGVPFAGPRQTGIEQFRRVAGL